MIVRDIRSEASGADGPALAAEIHFARGGAPFTLRYQLPGGKLEWLAETGDAFLAATLPLAMAAGEDLAIEAPVSARLLENTTQISSLYRHWGPIWRKELRPSEVSAQASLESERADGVGVFFSGGVDSFHSLLSHSAPTAIDPARRPSHLLFVHGLDIELANRELFESALGTVRRAASETGAAPVVVSTNLRELSEPLVHWELYHGAALASVALALGGLLGRCLVPSSFGFNALRPWGSHPLLDPLWSTERVEIVPDGTENTRARKISVSIAESRLALEQLRVCYQQRGGTFNCGRCEKCLLTMIALEGAGALERCRTLPSSVEPGQVRRLDLESPGSWASARNILLEMDQRGYRGPLRGALAARLRRSEGRILARFLLRRLFRGYRYPPRPKGGLLRRYPGMP